MGGKELTGEAKHHSQEKNKEDPQLMGPGGGLHRGHRLPGAGKENGHALKIEKIRREETN